MPFSLHDHINRAKSKRTHNDKLGKREFLELAPQSVCIDYGSLRYDDFNNKIINHDTTMELFKTKQVPFLAPICWLESDQQIILMDTRSPKIFRVQLFWPNKDTYFGGWHTYNYDNDQYSHELLDKFIRNNIKIGIREGREYNPDNEGRIALAIGFILLLNSQQIVMSDPIEIKAPPMEMPIADEPIEYQKYVYRKVELRTVKIPDTKVIPAEPVPHQQYDPDDALYHQRYHYRRGHYRYLRDGRKIPVKGCYAGNIGLGEIKHDYDCTELVAHQHPKRDLFDGRLIWQKPRVVQDLFA